MTTEIAIINRRKLARLRLEKLPNIVANAGDRGARRLLEFFTANIRNKNTRAAYLRAVVQFTDWLEGRDIQHLSNVEPLVIAAYIEQHPGSKPTVKQHLAAIRMLFNWLILGQVVATNPASAVRGPKHVVKRGKTPVLDDDQMQALIDSIDTSTLVGLRDRALIGVMAFDFARIGAVLAMDAEDYHQEGKKWAFLLHEKGGKVHHMMAHHSAEEFMDAYLA